MNFISHFIKYLFSLLNKNSEPMLAHKQTTSPIYSSKINPFPRSKQQCLKNRSLYISWKPGEELKEYSIAEFEKISGIRYLHHLDFKNPATLQGVKRQCEFLLKKNDIRVEAHWLGSLYSKEIKNGYCNDLSIQWVNDDIGYGVFAMRDLQAFEYIGEYTGTVTRRHLIFSNNNNYCFYYPSSYQFFTNYMIDSKNQGNITRYINHSEKANSEYQSVIHEGIFHVIMKTIKPIAAGEQVSSHYGLLYWRARNKSPNES